MRKQLLKYKKLLFKKSRKLDIFGILLILFMISLSYLLLNRKVEYLNVTLRLFNYEGAEYGVGGNKPRPWYVEKIVPGKKQTGGFGKTLVEVVDVYNYDGPSALQDTYVTLEIRATQNKTNKQYIYNGSPLLIHDVRSFKVHDLLIIGEIVDIENGKDDSQRETERFLITLDLFSKKNNRGVEMVNSSVVMIEGVENYIAESLVEEMEIRDNHKNTLVKIVDIDRSHGVRSWVGPNGYVETIDPNRTKVKLELEIVGEKINNYYYYRREGALIIDYDLHLLFDDLSVLGTITAVKPLTEK